MSTPLASLNLLDIILPTFSKVMTNQEDRYTVYDLSFNAQEQRLNNHDTILENNDTRLNNHDISLNNIVSEIANIIIPYLVPSGSIIAFKGTGNVPSGWLLCDGKNDTPDLRGRFILGHVTDTNDLSPGLTQRTIDISGGTETHILTIGELPSHNHSGLVDSNGNHTHTGTVDSNGSHTHSINDPGHTHTQTTINDDFNNSGASPPGFTADSAGSRTWNNISTNTTGITINADGIHQHTFTTNTSGTHQHTIPSQGGNQAHNNMPPFYVLRYIIKV
jgi:microcystin-dependent protein